MKTVLVTGYDGFIGRNLVSTLAMDGSLRVSTFGKDDPTARLQELLEEADFVFHLAGANRPTDPSAFHTVNVSLTQELTRRLEALGRPIPVLLASSTQAALETSYGASKHLAEIAVRAYAARTAATVHIYRLPNVFGKWSRPNYNSAVATFCHNAANGLPLEVHDPVRELVLVHVDDVVAAFLGNLQEGARADVEGFERLPRTWRITLGDLASRIAQFPLTRRNGELPEVGDDLTRRLYSMYLTYLPEDAFSYGLEVRRDPRGWLAEVLRSPGMGQIFVSVTQPGITRGNHWHHTKTEKFLVVQGEGLIRFRPLDGRRILEYPVSGEEPRVVDIPPGYVHNITNIGRGILVTLFWASEPFDPGRPDTYALQV